MILSIDPKLCTGCLACQVYCSLAHEGSVNPDLARIRLVQIEDRLTMIPVTCIPCEEKPCLAACPEEGALVVNSAGMVIIDEQKCTGCSRCVRACRIGAIRLHRLSGRGKNGRAVVLKCDQCGGDPWCARVCPSAAITRVEDAASGKYVHDLLVLQLQLLPTKEVENAVKDVSHG